MEALWRWKITKTNVYQCHKCSALTEGCRHKRHSKIGEVTSCCGDEEGLHGGVGLQINCES